MEDEQVGSRIPPLARRFLEEHRPARNDLGSAGRDADGDNGEGEGNSEAGDQRVDDGELEVDGPGVDGGPNVADDAEPGVPAPPIPLFAPRPRAKER